MKTIGIDVSIPQEKQKMHDERWGTYVSYLVNIVQEICPKCGNALKASEIIDADLFCIVCNSEYIVIGEGQLERINDGILGEKN